MPVSLPVDSNTVHVINWLQVVLFDKEHLDRGPSGLAAQTSFRVHLAEA